MLMVLSRICMRQINTTMVQICAQLWAYSAETLKAKPQCFSAYNYVGCFVWEDCESCNNQYNTTFFPIFFLYFPVE